MFGKSKLHCTDMYRIQVRTGRTLRCASVTKLHYTGVLLRAVTIYRCAQYLRF